MNSSIWTSVISKTSLCAATLFLRSCTFQHRQLLQEPPAELKDPWFQDHDGNKPLPSLEQQERDLGLPQPTSQPAQTVPSHLRDNKMSRARQPQSTAAWCTGQHLHPGKKNNWQALWWEFAPLCGGWSSPQHKDEGNAASWRNGCLMVQSVSAAAFYLRGRGSAEV